MADRHSNSKLCKSVAVFLMSCSVFAAANNDFTSIPAVNTPCAAVKDRPCVALVLGGGGARGGAHIGVLKAIEEYKIPVDFISGTSIGAFVGSLYATGKSPQDIEALFANADWNAGYKDNLSRSDIPIRRKRQIDSFPIQLDIGLGRSGIKLPQGFLQGQGMKKLVDSLLGKYAEFSSFDALPIPFRAVAADAETGQAVILDAGDLSIAVQSSMSLPGIVRPTERSGRLLIDGGVANNLPIDVAKNLGADIVIAVDIGAPLYERDQLASGITILRQLTGFLTHGNVEYQKSLLSESDIIIEPVLNDVGMLEFGEVVTVVQQGKDAAQQALAGSDLLARLGDTVDYGAQPRARLDPLAGERVIKRIDLKNDTRLSDEYLLRKLGLRGQTELTQRDIQDGVDQLIGQGTIARVSTSLASEVDGEVLKIDVDEKEWGPGYFDLKFTFEDDFSTFSRYQFGGSYRLTNISENGAEWFSAVELGTEKYFLTEIYWPLGNSDFFANAIANYENQVSAYTDEEGESLGEIRSVEKESKLGLGWNPRNRLDFLLGASHLNAEVEVPKVLQTDVGFSKFSLRETGGFIDINFDSFNDASFPTRGWKLAAELKRARTDLLDVEQTTTRFDAEYNGVISSGRHNLRTLVRAQSFVTEDDVTTLGSFELGGFLNLSGIPKDALSGNHVRFFSWVYTYEVAQNDFGAISLPLYLGASIEAGNVWARREDIEYSNLRESGSIFVGWDSPLGPAYLAYGQSDKKERSFYLYLGVVF
ncbi:patatin-like phospholipase family protein [Aurantivibrio plasticivorans]